MDDRYDAIVLAGGRASRMSGQAKPQLPIGAQTMLERVLSAVRGAGTRIVVGPQQPAPVGVWVVQEQPAGSGPVAGLAAGLAHASAPVVLVLAADLPFLTPEALTPLLAGLDDDAADVSLLVDENGRDQYLLGAWRVAALRTALTSLEPLPGRSMRELVRAVRVIRIDVPAPGDSPAAWTDVDTPADLDRARRAPTREQRSSIGRHDPGGPGRACL